MSNEVITTKDLQGEVAPMKEAAQNLVIVCTEDVEVARNGIREIKRRRSIIDEHCDAGIKQAHSLHKQLVADKKKFTDELDDAERIIKGKIGAFQIEEERQAKEAAEKARAEAYRIQQLQIAAAQKKIDATLSKAGTVQEMIESLEYSLQHDSLADIEREMVERKLEVLRLNMQGLQDKAEEAQRKAEAAAETYVAPVAVAPAEKVSGVSSKKVFQIVSIDNTKLVQAIAEGKAPANLVKAWDETALKKFATLGMLYPGVEYREERAVSIR
jgi:hypothetical protein